MRFAVIADIHGNIEALRAVLDDIAAQGIGEVFCAGDLVGYCPFPNEVVDLIREKAIPTVQGNYDEGVGEDLMVCGCDYRDAAAMEMGAQSLYWTQEVTTPENKEFLKALPKSLTLRVEGKDILIVHGSPRKNNEYLYEDAPALTEVVKDLTADLLICGHTHIPYDKAIGGKRVINAGSVGKPKHGRPEATYVVVTGQNGEIAYEAREVEYDYEKTARAIEASELPDHFAELIRTGKG